jgi:5-methylcytosine-specific restriction endonuclease McrA
VSRLVDPTLARRVLLVNRWCQICGEPSASTHHIVPRSHGGDDVPENLAALCGNGVTGCHGDVELHLHGARLRLFCALNEHQRAYAQRRKGAHWLLSYYGTGP